MRWKNSVMAYYGEREREAEKDLCYHEDDCTAGLLCPTEGGLAGLAHGVKCSQGHVG